MFATITPLAAAPQPTINPQHKREGISSAAKLVYFVGLLAFTIFGGGFFAILLASQREHGHQSQPLANRLSRRDVCTDTPVGIATGPELTLAASHALGSHYLVRGADGKYLQIWMASDGSSGYNLIDTGFNAGKAVFPNSNYIYSSKTAAIGWQNGGYELFITGGDSFINPKLEIDWIPVSSTGVAGAFSSYTATGYGRALSVASLPSGKAAVCLTDEKYPWLSVPQGSWNIGYTLNLVRRSFF